MPRERVGGGGAEEETIVIKILDFFLIVSGAYGWQEYCVLWGKRFVS